jgi:hypothetical protein
MLIGLPSKIPITTSSAVVGSSLSLIRAAVKSWPKKSGSMATRMRQDHSGI